MAPPQLSTKSPTIRRILREAAELSSTPSPDYTAEPLESDIFEWHFTLRGPPNSPYEQGLYHGRINLPNAYPLRPPSFRFTTPNGRFETNREICLSISGHHEETWQPAWGIRTAIVALRTFMETDARGQLGGLDTPEAVRKRFAGESPAFRCPTCARTNGEIIKDCEERYAAQDSAARQQEDVEVPAELNMGWKDELEAKTAAAAAGASEAGQAKVGAGGHTGTSISDSSAEKRPIAQSSSTASPAAPPAPAPAPASYPPARPAQTVPAPTASVPRAQGAPAHPHGAAQAAGGGSSNGGVPLWIDRLIVVLVVLLLALVLKLLFGVY